LPKQALICSKFGANFFGAFPGCLQSGILLIHSFAILFFGAFSAPNGAILFLGLGGVGSVLSGSVPADF